MNIALVYDGECRFCLRSLLYLKRFDSANALTLVDGNDREKINREFPALALADLDTAMYAVAADGVYRGYDAFCRAAYELPALRLVASAGAFAPIAAAGRVVYALVARHRKRLGCATDRCDIGPG